jgi:hypothetical protein
MPPGSFIVYFNILKDSLSHGSTGNEAFAMDQFHFQVVEEALCVGLVIWGAFSAHGANQNL